MRLHQIRIQNFRGIDDVTIDLDVTTVLIGENNAGKTSVLEAIHTCLSKNLVRKSTLFSEYDYRHTSGIPDPTTVPKMQLDFLFREDQEGQWPDTILQDLEKTLQVGGDGIQEIRFQVVSYYDVSLGDFVLEWCFLDMNGNKLTGANSPQNVKSLQLFTPSFLLRAVRDPIQEFGGKAQFWNSFTKNPDFPSELIQEIELTAAEINQKVLDAHLPFTEVKESLQKTGALVPLGDGDLVSIEAVPAKIHEMLDRTQVNLTSQEGTRLPVRQHGAGTQSLSIMFLFEAFLRASLAKSYDESSEPFVAIEEPESHLHPSAIKALWRMIESLRGQKIIATHSGDLMSEVPLSAIRRLARKEGQSRVYRVTQGTLSAEEQRKIGYHIRAKRGNLLFAKAWLFVEGESEYWFLPEAARLMGKDFDLAGVSCVEFAQCGLAPLIKLAIALGIEWHVLVDGDAKGSEYAQTARGFLGSEQESDRITQIEEKDLEHCLWAFGYENVYRESVGQPRTVQPPPQRLCDSGVPCRYSQPAPIPDPVTETIKAAIRSSSKPGLALAVITAASLENSLGLPPKIGDAVSQTMRYAGL